MSVSPSRRAARSRPLRRGWGVLLIVVAVVAVLGVAAASVVAFTLRTVEDKIERQDVFSRIEEQARPEPEPTRALDILVLGSDSRQALGGRFQGEGEEHVEGKRADTTILAHLNAERDAAWLVSIPRDSWVSLPACEGDDGERLPPRQGAFNEAFLDGGLQCTVRTVEALTGVRVDHTVVVDFAGFQDMVSALGGVPVCLDEPFRPSKVDLELAPGRHVLDGPEALAFARARYGVDDGSDLSRIERQKQLLAAMLDRALSKGVLARPDRLVRFLHAVAESLTVDEDLDLRELAMSVRNIDPNRVLLSTVPIDETPGPRFERGGSLFGRVKWDEQAAGEVFRQIRRDDIPLPSAEATHVEPTERAQRDEQEQTAAAQPPPTTTSAAAAAPCA